MSASAALTCSVVILAVVIVNGSDIPPADVISVPSAATTMTKVVSVSTWQRAAPGWLRPQYLYSDVDSGLKLLTEKRENVIRSHNAAWSCNPRRLMPLSPTALWVRGGKEEIQGNSERHPRAKSSKSRPGAPHTAPAQDSKNKEKKQPEASAVLPKAVGGALSKVSRGASMAWRAIRGRRRDHPVASKRASLDGPAKKPDRAAYTGDSTPSKKTATKKENTATLKRSDSDTSTDPSLVDNGGGATKKRSMKQNTPSPIPAAASEPNQDSGSPPQNGTLAVDASSSIPAFTSPDKDADEEASKASGSPRHREGRRHNSGRSRAAAEGRRSREQLRRSKDLGGATFGGGILDDPVPATEERRRKEDEVRDGLSRAELELGPAHPTVAALLFLLSRMVQERGDYAEAENLCARALNVYERTLGPEHPDLGVVLNCLALSWQAQVRIGGLWRRSLFVCLCT